MFVLFISNWMGDRLLRGGEGTSENMTKLKGTNIFVNAEEDAMYDVLNRVFVKMSSRVDAYVCCDIYKIKDVGDSIAGQIE